jgi:hypothetical protein
MPRFKTEPFAHQLAEVDEHWSTPHRCLWWEQGTGKTKAIIDTAAALYREGKIDAIFIIAPGGVHDNWILDEIPDHMPDEIPIMTHAFQTKSMRTKRFQTYAPSLLEFEGLAVLAMTFDSIMTQKKKGVKKFKYLGAEYAKAFLTGRKCLFVVDEGSYIKTPGAQVTKRLLSAAKYADYRRLLNGTPVIDSPMHAYSQVKWANPEIWEGIGIHAFQHYKVMFGLWQQQQLGNGRSFPQLLRYCNLKLLKEKMDEVGTRIRKDDVLDIPPKVYQRVYYDLSPTQRKVYTTLERTMEVDLGDDDMLTVDIAIVRDLRLQQITSGFAPTDDGGVDNLVTICAQAPRLKALEGVIERTDGSAIIWAKFKEEKKNIAALLEKMGHSYVVYSSKNRVQAKEDFQSGKARFFIANQSSGAARGITLTKASTVVYYSNTFSLDDRAQSEDRAHRSGQTKSVNYVDIIAKDTVDLKIVETLLKKQETSNEITGDQGKILDE